MNFWSKSKRRRAPGNLAGRPLPADPPASPLDALLVDAAATVEQRMVDLSSWEEYNYGTGLGILAETHDVTALYARITESASVDKTVGQWSSARAFGIKLGGYHLWRPGNGQKEADVFLATRKAFGYDDFPPILDFEQQTAPPVAMCNDFWSFADRVEQKTGQQVIIYTGGNYLPTDAAARARFQTRKVILAAYPTPLVTLTEANQWDKKSYSYQEPALLGWAPEMIFGWQFTDRGRITGCTAGGTDLNWYYPNGLPSSPPPGPPGGLWKATTTANLNVRTGPGTTYAILGSIPAGTAVVIDQRQNGWAHVIASTGQPLTGWCSETYLRYS